MSDTQSLSTLKPVHRVKDAEGDWIEVYDLSDLRKARSEKRSFIDHSEYEGQALEANIRASYDKGQKMAHAHVTARPLADGHYIFEPLYKSKGLAAKAGVTAAKAKRMVKDLAIERAINEGRYKGFKTVVVRIKPDA